MRGDDERRHQHRDNLKQYKGEEFENVLINVYLAMNFALEGKFDDALIECRRVNRKLYLMISDGRRKYELSAFAAYFSGILFEVRGEWNDAYISYKQTRDILPGFENVGEDLVRIAGKLRMTDEVKRWRKEYRLLETSGDRGVTGSSAKLLKRPLARSSAPIGSPKQGQIIVVFQNGRSPRKVPSPSFYSIPEFRREPNPVTSAKVSISALGSERAPSMMKQTDVLQNIESDAIKNLEQKWAGILAKKLMGIAAKETAGHVLNSKTGNSGVGDLLKLALYVSDQADLRSWSLLPKDLQIARFFVDPGTYTVNISPIERPDRAQEKVLQVSPGKTVFTTVRFVP